MIKISNNVYILLNLNKDSGESYLSYIGILIYFPKRIYNILFINYLFPNIRV